MIRRLAGQSLSQVRYYGKHNKNVLYKDGVKYGLIKYFPRTPDHVDEPVEPTKLLRVQRIKPVKGNPYWEKQILHQYGLAGDAKDFVVVKNIPEVNAQLWKIKHLIKVTPVTFPYGEPSANDIDYTRLNENGECLVVKELKLDPEVTKATEAFERNPKRLDGDTLKRDSRLKWVNPWW